jgi:hypothetical protein
VHEVAFVEDHVTAEILPEVMLVGLAVSVTVGVATLATAAVEIAALWVGAAGTPPDPASTTFTFVTTML